MLAFFSPWGPSVYPPSPSLPHLPPRCLCPSPHVSATTKHPATRPNRDGSPGPDTVGALLWQLCHFLCCCSVRLNPMPPLAWECQFYSKEGWPSAAASLEQGARFLFRVISMACRSSPFSPSYIRGTHLHLFFSFSKHLFAFSLLIE